MELGVLDGGNDTLDLLGFSVCIKVETVDGQVLEELDRLADSSVSGGDGDLWGNRGEGLVDLLELGTHGLGLVEDKDGLIDLDVLDTLLLQLGEELLVDGEQFVEELDGLKVGWGISALSDKRKVSDGTEEDRSGGDTLSLGLLVFLELLVKVELEGLVGRVVDLDNVVVGVEEFTHLRGNDIDTLLSVLSTSTHGKVGVERRQLLGGVSLRNDTKVVRVVEQVVVEGEVTAEGSSV